jgi:nanoRNase/pAp phosphatase (c-di-AMP/oligoRNAs hydrolase)
MQMLNKILKDAVTIAIGGHIRPDGDCVGSCMGLYHYIRDNYSDKKVDVYLEEMPDKFYFLKSTEFIRHEIKKGEAYDLFISLDCGDKERLGFSAPLFDQAKRTYCIDHHISNTGFAQDEYTVADASSTCELVYQLMEEDKISLDTAEALYLGIVHDTGVFQYTSASPSTFRMAANLLEKGVDGARLIQDTYYEKTYAQNQILGRTLLESILFMDKTCIASYVTKKTMDFYGVKVKDLDGIVSQLRVTKDIEVAIFMYELETNVYKVSLRSKERVDVSKVAKYFGGGGHKKAAGLTMAGTYYDVLNNLSRQIEAQILGQK